MDQQKHKQRHVELHQAFDELLADYIRATQDLPSKTPILHLLEWSYKQTQEPDHQEP